MLNCIYDAIVLPRPKFTGKYVWLGQNIPGEMVCRGDIVGLLHRLGVVSQIVVCIED